MTRFIQSRVFLSYPIFFLFASQQKERILVRGGRGCTTHFCQTLCFYPSPYPSPSRGEGTTNYGLYKSRRLKVFESFFLSIFVRSTVKDYLLFTIHHSLFTHLSFAKYNVCSFLQLFIY